MTSELLAVFAASSVLLACFYDFDRNAPALHDAGAGLAKPSDGGVSDPGDQARPASCGDGAKNGNESDVDCGGACAPCANGRACGVGADCAAGGCRAGQCATAASCKELQASLVRATSGVFEIAPTGTEAPFKTFCEMTTDGGGWTMVYKSTQTTSQPNTMLAHFFTGNGLPALLDEVKTPDDQKFVMLDIPSFGELLLKADSPPNLQANLGNTGAGDAVRASWKAFFGPAGSDKDVTANPVVDGEYNCTDPAQIGVFRRRHTYIYPMQGVAVCMPAVGDGGADVATLYVGDQGCGTTQCYATSHVFFPTAAGTAAPTAFSTLDKSNTNVRLYVR